MSTTYSLAWYNLENLFDHQNAPRPDYLKKQLGRSPSSPASSGG